jgi:hypothetical protein
MEKVVEGLRKFLSDKLHKVYSSSNTVRVIKSRMMIWAEHTVCKGAMRKVYKILFRKPQGMTSLLTLWHIWKDNTEMDLKEIGCKNVDWIQLGQEKVQ